MTERQRKELASRLSGDHERATPWGVSDRSGVGESAR